MSELFVAVVSITSTRRRRFLWAAWWTEPPVREPFRRPDAAEGGARTREEALREAERVAGRRLVEIEGLWARAWAQILLGRPPFAQRGAVGEERRVLREVPEGSIWEVLGVSPQASVSEIRAAFRKRTLITHPDRGGDPEEFRALRRAHDEALARRARQAKRPRGRSARGEGP